MSTLELKGGIIEMIAQVKDKELLQQLYQTISAIMVQNGEEVMPLSDEMEAQLDEDLKAIENPANLIPHEEVLKLMQKWRTPTA